jgi:hypothetical protein
VRKLVGFISKLHSVGGQPKLRTVAVATSMVAGLVLVAPLLASPATFGLEDAKPAKEYVLPEIDEEIAPGIFRFDQIVAGWVSEERQNALDCNRFYWCLHFQVLESANCSSMLKVDYSLWSKSNDLVATRSIFVSSQNSDDVFELGVEPGFNFDSFTIDNVTCSMNTVAPEFL